MSNVIVHAYRGRSPPGALDLTLEARDGAIHVAIRDFGLGLVPRDDSPGLGLGLGVIGRVADRVEINAPAAAARSCGWSSRRPPARAGARVGRGGHAAGLAELLDDVVGAVALDDLLGLGHDVPGRDEEAAPVAPARAS